MPLKYVYIAGPYTGRTHDHRSYFEIQRHITDALEVARELAQLGYGFFCPHQHSAHFEVIAPNIEPAYWYELNIHFMLDCDAILLLPGWPGSRGTIHELQIAHDRNIPVFHSIDELVRYMPPED